MQLMLQISRLLIIVLILVNCGCKPNSSNPTFCDGFKKGLEYRGYITSECMEKPSVDSYEYGLLKGVEYTSTNPFLYEKIEGSDQLYVSIRDYGRVMLGLDLDTLSVYDVSELRGLYSGYHSYITAPIFDDSKRKLVSNVFKVQLPDARMLLNRRRMHLISIIEHYTGFTRKELCEAERHLCNRSLPKLIFNGRTCTVDCSGHIAGYEWAEDRVNSGLLVDEDDCISGKSSSFQEGCYSYFDEF